MSMQSVRPGVVEPKRSLSHGRTICRLKWRSDALSRPCGRGEIQRVRTIPCSQKIYAHVVVVCLRAVLWRRPGSYSQIDNLTHLCQHCTPPSPSSPKPCHIFADPSHGNPAQSHPRATCHVYWLPSCRTRDLGSTGDLRLISIVILSYSNAKPYADVPRHAHTCSPL